MFRENKISEGGRGNPRFPAEDIIPPDAEKLSFETESYEFYIHQNNGDITLYVQTVNYHPGILALPLKKLEELINYLEK